MKEAYNKDDAPENEHEDAESGDKEILEEALEFYDYSMKKTEQQRKDAFDDMEFAMLDMQWDEALKTKRKKEGKPCLTINKLKPFIKQVVNDARLNKPAISVHPADSKADKETAEIYAGLIRNIENVSNANDAYDTAIEHAVSAAIGFYRINVEQSYDDTFDMDIKIERITNSFSVVYDVDSTAADSSDWNKCIVESVMPHEEYEARYPDAEMVDWKDEKWSSCSDWVDEKTVKVCEYWKREKIMRKIVKLNTGEIVGRDVFDDQAELFQLMGIEIDDEIEVPSYKVTQYILSGIEVLEKIDWKGKYIPIIPVYGEEICIANERIFRSMIHGAKDAQTMVNYFKTTTIELMALTPRAPFIGPVGAFNADAHKWATANTENHAYIEFDVVDGGPPQRQGFSGPPTGMLQEALNATDDMKSILGMYDASLGARSNETSGVAINARKHEGDVGTFHFADNQARSIRHGGCVIIDLIPHVYTGDRIIRILGEEKKEPKNVKLGKVDPAQQQEQQSPYPEGVERIFDLSVGKYDLTVSTGPSFSSRREEAAAQMMQFIQVYPQAGPLIGDLYAGSLDWQYADEISKRLKVMLPPALQEGGQSPEVQAMQQQMQQMQQMMQQQMQQAQQQMGELSQKLQQSEMKLQGQQLDKEIELRKTTVDEFNAETKRLEMEKEGMTPEQIQLLIIQTLQNLQQLPTDGNIAESQPQMQPQMQDLSAMQPQQPDQWQEMPAPTDNGVQ